MSTILKALRDAARERDGGDARRPGPDPDLAPALTGSADAAGQGTDVTARRSGLPEWAWPVAALVLLAASALYAWQAGMGPRLLALAGLGVHGDAAPAGTAAPAAPVPGLRTDSASAPATAPMSNPAPTEAAPVPAAAPSMPAVRAEPATATPPATVAMPPTHPATGGTNNRLPERDALPLALRSALPPLRIGARIEARGRGAAVLIVDGRAYDEGQALTPELKLVRVEADHAVFSIRGQAFRVTLP